MSVVQGVLPYKIESAKAGHLTSFGGLPLVVELCRRVFGRKMYRTLSRRLGVGGPSVVRRYVESLVALLVSGGDCIEDIERLRADGGLARLLGFKPTGRTQLKEFLYSFHQDTAGHRLTHAQDAELSKTGVATIRPEGPGLQALDVLVRSVVTAAQARRACQRATLDVDATIIEAGKERALVAYEGTRGYQPQNALWAEQGLVVADEFRDGNVPAAFAARAFLERAFGALPASVTERRLRADSAFYDEAALTWADEQAIQFAVSADMSQSLAATVSLLPETSWQPYRSRDEAAGHSSTEERQWAEVVFVPPWARNHKKTGRAFRYLAIRVRSRQGELFEPSESSWRHFAVVTNRDDVNGERLLNWHREKAGTIEHVFGDIKGELGGRTMPTGKFGSNAAWWRINVLVYNLLRLLKVQALPEELHTARPKKLRFHLLNVAGEIVKTAGSLLLRLAVSAMELARLQHARQAIARMPAPST